MNGTFLKQCLRWIALVAVCSSSTLTAATQQKKELRLSLPEAISMAEQHNKDIALQEQQLQAARADVTSSLQVFLPQVSFSETFVRSNDPVAVFGFKLRQAAFTEQDFALPSLNEPNAYSNFATSLQVRQPLFNIDGWYHRAAAERAETMNLLLAERTKQAIRHAVEMHFSGWLLAQQQQEAIQRAIRAMETLSQEVQAAESKGLVTRADVLAVEVQLVELKDKLTVAQHGAQSAAEMLLLLLGENPAEVSLITDAALQGLTGNSSFSPISMQNIISERSDIRALEQGVQAAEHAHAANTSWWIPKLNAFGGLEYNSADPFGTDGSLWNVGVQLQWNIFSGMSEFGKAEKSKTQVESAKILHKHTQQAALQQAQNALREIRAAEARIEGAKKAVEHSTESLRIVRARFAQGLERSSDVLFHESNLTMSQIRLAAAYHDLNAAVSKAVFAGLQR